MKKSTSRTTVILRADVDNLGRLGDQVSVKPGYARNYLLPQGLAMPATQSNLKVFEQERRKLEAKMDAMRAEARSLAEKIEAEPVAIEVRVGEGDKLYGSVTSPQIAEALAQKDIEIDRRKIVLEEPIRALGEYEIPVKLHPDVTANLVVYVHKKGQTIEDIKAAMAEANAEAPEAEAAPETIEEANVEAVIEGEVDVIPSESEAYTQVAEPEAPEAAEATESGEPKEETGQ
jgi:large subunit ribosomal protein L9